MARQYQCGSPLCTATGLHPAPPGHAAPTADVASEATTRAQPIDRWWSEKPYSLLAPTGLAFDAIQVPTTALATPPPRSLEAPLGLIEQGGVSHWLLLTQPGEPVPVDHPVRQIRGALVHQVGSWIVLPPSPLAGTLRWVREPSAYSWQLPPLAEVLEVVKTRLPHGGRTPARDLMSVLPPQSTRGSGRHSSRRHNGLLRVVG